MNVRHRPELCSETATRASLRKRFIGLDEILARAVGDFADRVHGRSPYRVFADIRPILAPGLRIETGWTVHVIATGPLVEAVSGSVEIRMPVIPDAFNPRPGKVIEASDKAYEFGSMVEAERAGVVAVDSLTRSLAELVPPVRPVRRG